MNAYSFAKVFDGANRRIRGLWSRNGSYYVQTTVKDARSGVKRKTRLRLPDAKTVPDAKQAAAVLLSNIAENGHVTGKAGPTFADYSRHYLEVAGKSPKTMKEESVFLSQWERFLGSTCRLPEIDAKQVIAYRAAVVGRGCSNRTANLHMTALRAMLNLAKTEGHLETLPTEGLKPFAVKQTKKPLLKNEELIAIGAEALLNFRTGEQFANLLALGMYCGGRKSAVLALKWENVDWERKQLVFTGEHAKGRKNVYVSFNKNLENHLLCMFANKSSDYLFPSYRQEGSLTTMKNTLTAIRAKLNLPHFSFHSLRHYFTSTCVMAGIDYMTTAGWLGHKDGGVLIGKTYGHLNNTHIAEQAKKLTFAL